MVSNLQNFLHGEKARKFITRSGRPPRGMTVLVLARERGVYTSMLVHRIHYNVCERPVTADCFPLGFRSLGSVHQSFIDKLIPGREYSVSSVAQLLPAGQLQPYCL